MVLASGSSDNRIAIWNPFNFSLLNQISTHQVRCLKWLGPTTGYLASGGYDDIINIWDTIRFKFVRRLEGHSDRVNTLDVLSNGYLASGSQDENIKVWDANTGQVVKTFSSVLSASVYRIDQMANGLLAVVGDKKSMVFLNLTSSSLQSVTVANGNKNLNGLLLYSNDQVLATAYDQKFSLINTTSFQKIQDFSTTYTPIRFEYASISSLNSFL